MRLHHVQLVIPQGQVDTASAFYGGVIGMTRLEKPPGGNIIERDVTWPGLVCSGDSDSRHS